MKKQIVLSLMIAPWLLLGAYEAEPLYLPWINASGHVSIDHHPFYWHGDRLEKKIALTFDDGPSALYTEPILKILKDGGVKATFFLVGSRVEQYPSLARRIVQDGHAIGNHTENHARLFFKTRSDVEREISNAQRTITLTTGVRPALFRPPHGADNRLIHQTAAKMGVTVVIWSVSSKDWTDDSAEKILARITRHAQNGSIVLLHDGSPRGEGQDRSKTVRILPSLIRTLQERGYELVTVPELLHLPS